MTKRSRVIIRWQNQNRSEIELSGQPVGKGGRNGFVVAAIIEGGSKFLIPTRLKRLFNYKVTALSFQESALAVAS